MDLSIIIVNYNVKYFLEQCLHSVSKAIQDIESEVYVVDNNSVDGSCHMVREKFPFVQLIDNHQNVGFSKANNQALHMARGKYVLILNPDTIVEENTFLRCLEFMDNHPEAGALGVKMIDGKGNFLPESKRALPTPGVAFYKIFGLSSLFPRSKTFNRYNLGYLSENETHEVDILCGAFMFMRSAALEESGLLDEDFFMYGEDIDLSYRIQKSGYKNYYFAGTRIIHYKGESTKKGSINYVLIFYNAMIIFARKHFNRKNANVFSSLIKVAIYFRAALSIFKRFVSKMWLPGVDFLIIYIGNYLLAAYYQVFKFGNEINYPPFYYNVIIPSYIIIWVTALYFSGGYDKSVRIKSIFQGIFSGTLFLLVLYALLPETMRYSRILLLAGTLWALLSSLSLRFIIHQIKMLPYSIASKTPKRFLIAGMPEEVKRVEDVLQKTQIRPQIVGFVALSDHFVRGGKYLGSVDQVAEIVRVHKVDEVVFCAKDLTSREIINHMLHLAPIDVDFKIAPPESMSIIGSNSINTAGEFYAVSLNTIGKESNRRLKRLFDFISSTLLIPALPLLLFFFRHRRKLIDNIFSVFFGKKTWIGYAIRDKINVLELPKIKPGVISPADQFKRSRLSLEETERLNLLYAKEYDVVNDAQLFFKCFGKLDR